MRSKTPIILGVILLLLGVVWASQGAGIAGSGSYMDNNPTFVNLGALLAVAGIALMALGTFWKAKVKAPAAKQA